MLPSKLTTLPQYVPCPFSKQGFHTFSALPKSPTSLSAPSVLPTSSTSSQIPLPLSILHLYIPLMYQILPPWEPLKFPSLSLECSHPHLHKTGSFLFF